MRDTRRNKCTRYFGIAIALAIIAWNAPSGQIDSYRIYINDGANPERYIEVPGAQTSVGTSALGCLPRVSYTLSATALNGAGESPRSNPVSWIYGLGDVFIKLENNGQRSKHEEHAAGVLVK